MLRFEEALEGWRSGRLSQNEAALLLGVCDRTFRRQMARYESEGLDELIDKRISQVSHRRAPVDEVVRIVELYQRDYKGWNVKHFHGWYAREHGGERSYTWVKKTLQERGVVARANQYLQQQHMPRHNQEFTVASAQPGSAFVPYIGTQLPEILCEQFERTVGNDNCVSFEGLTLQIPPDDLLPLRQTPGARASLRGRHAGGLL
ncbi:helix-turn-helix domain-containing protein [Candidimonas nitroreducens]|uniref:helix-turn-helix domain-containing protein n=1 Tax=Candidimonas nitroreducens TaxID=683354 RepID=UPI0018E915E7|nr:helix-turn-helix domain-containing protein [Candidimonas nitroreducens]